MCRHSKQNPPSDPNYREYVYDGWMGDLLRSHVALQKAVTRLEKGDKSCFKFLGAAGHFSEGLLAISWWQDMLGRYLHAGGSEFPPYHSPLWGRIEAAMQDCWAAYAEVGVILEPRFLDVAASIASIEHLLDPSLTSAATIFRACNARVDLPLVPDPDPPTLVATGREIPCYGIWEPVRAETSGGDARGLVKRWLGTDAPSAHGIDGCMNYLCEGSPAPTIGFPEDTGRKAGRATLWRLIWRDDRYGDNGVPEEERAYVFHAPKTAAP